MLRSRSYPGGFVVANRVRRCGVIPTTSPRDQDHCVNHATGA
jgi:hypothetical protein